MPQRTNDFQELVTLIQRALAPAGATVTESALVEVDTGSTREIDVLIDTKVMEYRIRIAVEVKDEKRPMDMARFDAIVGKYRSEGGVKVNKIVLVTHHGFTSNVIERAKKIDIDLLTLKEAKQLDWSELRPPGPTFECSLDIQNIQLKPESVPQEEAMKHGTVSCSCGRQYGTVLQFAQQLFVEIALKKQAKELEAFDREAAQKGERKKCRIDIGSLSEAGHERFLPIDGRQYKIEQVSFEVYFHKLKPHEITQNAQIRFAIAPHICNISLSPPAPDTDPKTLTELGHVICSCCNRDHGTLAAIAQDYVGSALKSNPGALKSLQDALLQSPTGHAYLDITFPLEQRRIAIDGNQFPIEQLTVRLHAVANVQSLSLAPSASLRSLRENLPTVPSSCRHG